MMIHISNKIIIPDNEIEITALRSQGPGGQHVNKVSTAVQIRFDIQRSSLPETYKNRLLHLRDKRITKNGIIILKVQEYRSQKRNKETALLRLSDLIRRAMHKKKKRIPTKPTQISRQKRLESKMKRSRLKEQRRKVKGDE